VAAILAGSFTRASRQLAHDAEKWEPVFGKTSCAKKKLERDDDSKKSHHALTARIGRSSRCAGCEPLGTSPPGFSGFLCSRSCPGSPPATTSMVAGRAPAKR